jgi:hypothetical protein
MKYFIDTEFLEGNQDKRFLGIKYGETKPTIDLISIGIVCEDGREYYAISKDFNLKEAWNRYDIIKGDSTMVKSIGDNQYKIKNYWIRENVLLPIYRQYVSGDARNHIPFTYSGMKYVLDTYGKTNKQIAEEIKQFVGTKETIENWEEIKDKMNTQFYGYYSDYDWVVFCWLFGRMINLPKGFPMYCIDLQQESDRIYNIKKEEYTKGGGRNFISKMSNHLDYPRQTNEHNALSDARWNYELYKFLQQL